VRADLTRWVMACETVTGRLPWDRHGRACVSPAANRPAVLDGRSPDSEPPTRRPVTSWIAWIALLCTRASTGRRGRGSSEPVADVPPQLQARLAVTSRTPRQDADPGSACLVYDGGALNVTSRLQFPTGRQLPAAPPAVVSRRGPVRPRREWYVAGMTRPEPSGDVLAANLVHFTRLCAAPGSASAPAIRSTRSAPWRRSTSWCETILLGAARRAGPAATATTRCSTRRSGCSGAIRWACAARWRCSCRRSGADQPAMSRRSARRGARPRRRPRRVRARATAADRHVSRVLRRRDPATRDFDEMSAEELAGPRRWSARLELDVRPLITRRTRPAVRGEIDRARTIRAALRAAAIDDGCATARGPSARPRSSRCATSRARWGATPRCCCGSCTRCSPSAAAARCSCSRPGPSATSRAPCGHRDVDAALARCGRRSTTGPRDPARDLPARVQRTWSRRVLAQGASCCWSPTASIARTPPPGRRGRAAAAVVPAA